MMATSRYGGLSALSGVVFLALFAVGFGVSNLLASEPYPSPFDSLEAIEGFVRDNRPELRLLAFLYSLAAVALLGFTASVAAFVRRTGEEARALSALALGGAVLAVAFLLLSALASWLLARPMTSEEPALLRTVHDLVYLAGGPAHVLAFAPFLGAGSIAARKAGALPGWLTVLGFGAAGASLLSVTALLWEPSTFILPLGRVLAFAWIFAVSLVLYRRAGTDG